MVLLISYKESTVQKKILITVGIVDFAGAFAVFKKAFQIKQYFRPSWWWLGTPGYGSLSQLDFTLKNLEKHSQKTSDLNIRVNCFCSRSMF